MKHIDESLTPYCAYCRIEHATYVEASIHARVCKKSPLVQEIAVLKSRLELARELGDFQRLSKAEFDRIFSLEDKSE